MLFGRESILRIKPEGQVVVACTRIYITEKRRAQLLLPNIESIDYVYIMHARSVMQQKKGRKKGKAEGMEKIWKI
jgi:hypothetical protein